ncbi:MAG: hypothetical protein LBQ88_22680 [Treponema sp.]|jgi:hypothetical protein|nr:hypothetical protein [Treponema sp.]
MGLDLGGLSISPYVDIAVGFHRENKNQITKDYFEDTQTGKVIGDSVSNSQGHGKNYIKPDFTAGADITFLNSNGVEAAFGIKYGINFDLYSNDWDIFGRSGSVAGEVEWSNAKQTVSDTANIYTVKNEGEFAITEKSAFNHAVTPSLSITKEIDERLALGFSAEIGVGIETSSDKSRTEKVDETLKTWKNGAPSGDLVDRTTVVTDRTLTETSVFSIRPVLSAGASFYAAPNRFKLNAGVQVGFGFTNTKTRVTPQGYDYTVTDTTDQYGNETNGIISNVGSSQTDSLKVSPNWERLIGKIGAGFTFFFSPKFTLDANSTIADISDFSDGFNARW